MNHRLYSMRDAAVGAFERPVVCRSDAEAVRMVRQTLSSGESHLNQSPTDYSLWFVGELDAESGVVLTPDSPECIVSASAMSAMSDEFKNRAVTRE